MRTQRIIEVIQQVMQNRSGDILWIIDNIRGGWEAWLQVETIVGLAEELAIDHYTQREVNYPHSGQIADIVLYPRSGVTIYLELKTQNAANDDILTRFQNDVTKIENQRHANPAYVYVAVSVMRTFDVNTLFDTSRPAGSVFQVWQFRNSQWKNYAENRRTLKNDINTIAVVILV